MGGVNRLYAKVHADLLEKPQVHQAARHLSLAMRVPEDFALMAILGFQASIDLWLVKKGESGEDGHLPGDGYAAIRQSAMVSPELARACTKALSEASLLVVKDGETVRVGFADDYHDLIRERIYQRNKRRGKGLRRSPTPRRRVGVKSPTSSPTPPPTSGDPRLQTSESLTALDSKVPDPVVDVALRSREAPEPAATAPGVAPSTAPPAPCGLCEDGLVKAHGGMRCCVCERGRARARAMKRGADLDRAQAGRASLALLRRGDGDSGPLHIRELVPSARRTLGLPGDGHGGLPPPREEPAGASAARD